MYSNSDNLDYDYIELLNTLNQENNGFQIINNNFNYFSNNLNNLILNENKDLLSTNVFDALSSRIFGNLNNLRDLGLNNKPQINNFGKKSKKIFNILHIKRKSPVNDSVYETQNQLVKSSTEDKKENISNEDDFKSNLIYSDNNCDKNNSLTEIILSEQSKTKPHNKSSDDNLIKKCKHLVLDSVMEFINKKIFTIYNGNIGNNIYRKELLTLNKKQKSNSNIIFNREFANKTISDILSDNISTRYTNYLPEHNKLLIQKLRNDNDEIKKIYFNILFNITFNQCLSHFIGKEFIEELEGMKCFEDIKDTLGDDVEYINLVKYYLENFENIVKNKNPRRPKKSKN